MPTVNETVAGIAAAPDWNERIARLRLISQHHGTDDAAKIYAAVAKRLYVPHLAPDFAYIHRAPFHDSAYFDAVYASAWTKTRGFRDVNVHALTAVLMSDPRTLLVFRTITGLTKDELAHSTLLAADLLGMLPVSSSQVDAMERRGTATSRDKPHLLAETITRVMEGSLFGEPRAC